MTLPWAGLEFVTCLRPFDTNQQWVDQGADADVPLGLDRYSSLAARGDQVENRAGVHGLVLFENHEPIELGCKFKVIRRNHTNGVVSATITNESHCFDSDPGIEKVEIPVEHHERRTTHEQIDQFASCD